MTTKLKALPSFAEMHEEKDLVKLPRAIKGHTFTFNIKKEYKMSLVDAVDRLYRFYQAKDMTNPQFL
jgi:hypothetical protein